jgi:UDPglucose 6-dehydrogenase
MFVIGYDLDAAKVHAVNHGHAPVQEPDLEEAVSSAGLFLRATTDPEEAVRSTDACIFVAPTPSLPDGSFDNQYLLNGIDKIASAVCREQRDLVRAGVRLPYIFIIASTITPGSCEEVLLPAIRKYSGHIALVYKPELIALGTVMHDLANPDVALLGASDQQAAKEVSLLYARLQGIDSHRPVEFTYMSFIEAELAKISLNCAITMKISFANQVGMVARQLGADPHTILDFIGRDSRVGNKALKPGMPFGGPCFPRDNRMFQHIAEKVGIIPHLAIATDRINQNLLQYILDLIPVDGYVGILGLAYKTGTAITEEAAGILLVESLRTKGRTVKVHDPLLAPHDLNKALACPTIIVTMDCPEYRELEIEPGKILVDPMNVIKQKIAVHN